MKVTITRGTARYSSTLRSDSRAVIAMFKAIGCPRQYDQRQRAYIIPTSRLDDVATYLEFVMRAQVQVLDANQGTLIGGDGTVDVQ